MRKGHQILNAGLLAALLLIAAAGGAWAAAEPLTDNHDVPVIEMGGIDSQGRVLWTQTDSEQLHTGVYLYDGQTKILSDPGIQVLSPCLNNGQAVWEGDWEENGEVYSHIYFYDGQTVRRLTDNGRLNWGPRLSNGQVVWTSSLPDYTDMEICWFDGQTVKQLTNDGFDNFDPDIDQGKIVWTKNSDQGMEIMYFNGTAIQQLTSNSSNDWGARIHQGKAVWVNDRPAGTGTDIFFWDGQATHQLTNDENWEYDPLINNGQAVWTRGYLKEAEIYSYDGQQVKRLTNNNVSDGNPRLDQGNVVWVGQINNQYQIFFYDGQTRQITSDGFVHDLPAIAGQQIAWVQTNSDGGSDIWRYQPDPLGVQLSVEAPSVQVGSAAKMTAAATGLTNPVYQFWIQSSQDGSWTPGGDYGSDTYYFTRSVPGTYTVLVFAKGAADPYASAIQSQPVTVTFTGNGVSALVVNGPNGAQSVGSSATFVATATDPGGDPRYQFWLHDSSGWRIVRDYSNLNSYALDNLQTGSYVIAVYALDQADIAAGKWAAAYYQVFILNVGSSVSLSPPAAPVAAGSPLTVNALASGIVGCEYQFWYQAPDSSWHQSGGYQTSGQYTFTPTMSGTYKVVVFAKDHYAPATDQFSVSNSVLVAVN